MELRRLVRECVDSESFDRFERVDLLLKEDDSAEFLVLLDSSELCPNLDAIDFVLLGSDILANSSMTGFHIFNQKVEDILPGRLIRASNSFLEHHQE